MAPPVWLGWLNENVINVLYDFVINPLRDLLSNLFCF